MESIELTDIISLSVWRQESKETTAGVVIAGENSQLIAAAALSLPPVESARIAETMACKDALIIASEIEAQTVVLSGEAKAVLESLAAARERNGKREEGVLKEEIKELISLMQKWESLSFHFCGREGNHTAHHLAVHVARDGHNSRWIQNVPAWRQRIYEKSPLFLR